MIPITDPITDQIMAQIQTGAAILARRCYLAAISPAGELKWLSEPMGSHAVDMRPQSQTLKAMERLEVVVGPLIFRGANGALRFQGSGRWTLPRLCRMSWSIIVDLEGDGQQVLQDDRSIIFMAKKYAAVKAHKMGLRPRDQFRWTGEFIVVGNRRPFMIQTVPS